MKKIALVSRNDEVSIKIAATIQNQLVAGGMTYSEDDPEIVCTIGGDGTFLSAIHKYMNRIDDVAFMGIHTGTLGFFADYTLKEMKQMIEAVLTAEPEIEEKRLLKIHLNSIDKDCYAVNEMCIQSHRTQTIEVYLGDSHLETYHGSGLILSTQMGSTAYSRSLGGAVVAPGMDIMQLTEFAGIHHSRYHSLMNPLIISGEDTVRFVSDSFTEAMLCFDRYSTALPAKEELVCSLSDHALRLAHYKKVDWVPHLEQLF